MQDEIYINKAIPVEKCFKYLCHELTSVEIFEINNDSPSG